MVEFSSKSFKSRHLSPRRKGAILSVEWLMVFPILVAVMFAITEFSLLWSGKHSLEAATYAAAREASLPAIDELARRTAAEMAAERILGDDDFIADYTFSQYEVGTRTGDPVIIELTLPMASAAPDLLKVIGISIEGKTLKARTVMRRE